MRKSVLQFAELFSTICGDRIPQFAEILFTKTGVSYLLVRETDYIIDMREQYMRVHILVKNSTNIGPCSPV